MNPNDAMMSLMRLFPPPGMAELVGSSGIGEIER
jgi:hypothetical protein